MITLRQDQAKLDSDIDDAFDHGARNVLGVLPTGGGKSVIVSERALRQHLMGSVQVKIAHRNELVGQLSMHIARRGIKHRIIAPRSTIASVVSDHRAEFGRSFVVPDSNCSVAGVDTLIARA